MGDDKIHISWDHLSSILPHDLLSQSINFFYGDKKFIGCKKINTKMYETELQDLLRGQFDNHPDISCE